MKDYNERIARLRLRKLAQTQEKYVSKAPSTRMITGVSYRPRGYGISCRTTPTDRFTGTMHGRTTFAT